MNEFDAIVVGAGAAGMMCAAVAGQRGLKVALVDHADKIGEKIRISGGGRCNFTNLGTQFDNFVSTNPRFAKFALAEYTPTDFLDLLKEHGVAWHEKHKGQLFCDDSSQNIIDVLQAECAKGNVHWYFPVSVKVVEQETRNGVPGYLLHTEAGPLFGKRLVIATGGLSIPKIGATDFGYRVAEQFGLKLVPTAPALVPLTFAPQDWGGLVELAGLALPVRIGVAEQPKGVHFDEDLLFTHKGLSGPGVLQISSYWEPGQHLSIDLIHEKEFLSELLPNKSRERRQLDTVLGPLMPKRLVEGWLNEQGWSAERIKPVNELGDAWLRKLEERLRRWQVCPNGSEGYRKAEVTRGGVACAELDSKSMQAKRQLGLHFIGEVVDMTGWLGGYNFQWAWASAHACGRSL